MHWWILLLTQPHKKSLRGVDMASVLRIEDVDKRPITINTEIIQWIGCFRQTCVDVEVL